MIKNNAVVLLIGLWVNICALSCVPSISMEPDQPDNTAVLTVFKNPSMASIIGNNLRSKSTQEDLWSVYSSCKTLHDLWHDKDAFPINHPEFLQPKLQDQLYTNSFLHWFLWVLDYDLKTLQCIDIDFLHPLDGRMGIKRLKAKESGKPSYDIPSSFDYEFIINISVPIIKLLESMCHVRKIEQHFYPRNLRESSPFLSLDIQAKLWFVEFASREYNYEFVLNHYLNTYRPDSFSKSLGCLSAGSLMDFFKSSFFYNEYLFQHPKIAFFYGVATKRDFSYFICSSYRNICLLPSRFGKIKKDHPTGDLILMTKNYFEINHEIFEKHEKNLFETAISAGVANAQEIYEHIKREDSYNNQ